MRKAKGVNPDRKSGAGVPKAVWCCTQHLSGNSCGVYDPKRTGFAFPLVPSSMWRGGTCCLGYSLSSIDISPGLRPGEDTPASPHSVDTTRVVVDTSYKSESIGVEKDARDYNRRWERFRSHWTTTARLKLGSPRTIRCCPATVCLPHWVRGA